MRYRDLVQFEPIETVVKLTDADQKQAAASLVQSYVISDRMADRLVNLVFPQLQTDRPLDNKGVLIVGNYGTGKSHLMSFISSLAEHADLLPLVRNDAVRDAAASIAGRFKVVRAEIGGVTRSLRDIVLGELEQFFAAAGTPYTFPSDADVTNNKTALIEVISRFCDRYPDSGVLFVLDEMLDYLRSREERALLLDLGFLRELGEVTAATPFRFMGGVQETLFDNPRFSFVAEQVRRVRDRFEQVRIARDDIAYVVAERLLTKSDAQLAQITEHLRRFTPLYPTLAERLGEYARLFPIHPAYIETFERVYIAEQREVLKTFSTAIRTVLDQEVPAQQTGLISYDHYWNLLRENPSLRTLPGVVEVVEKSAVLEGRIANAYTRKQLQPMAIRIIHALSVHRLTTSDINAPLGVTAEELRDQLCLWAPMPEADAGFLTDTVLVALREIMRTVSGQYISHNPDNGQFFLNLKKTVDFDAKIAERGAFLEARDLNRYFFDGLQRLLGLSTTTYVTGFSIWPYELPWDEKKVTRPGYLFFGVPSERSTAQPPRDFYVYMLPPFDTPKIRNTLEPDELVLQLQQVGGELEDVVRKYAGAQAMAAESPSHQQEYRDKADAHLRTLLTWLRQHLNSQLRITHDGRSYSVPEVLTQARSSASRDAEELVRLLAAQLLTPSFARRYPEYPAFRQLAQPVSEEARPNTAMDAVRLLAGRGRTRQALAVLDGLRLLDAEERIRPLAAPNSYAQYFLEKLTERNDTQVVNQTEILDQIAGGTKPIFKDHQFGLEPEWVVVVLLALVYDGKIALSLGGDDRLLDAASIERAAAQAMETLTEFRFYRRPRALPEESWVRLFEAFGLQPSLVRDEATRERAVQELQAHVRAELNHMVEWQGRLQGGLTVWGRPLFTDGFRFVTQGTQVIDAEVPPVRLSQTDLLPYVRKTKELLEQLIRYDRPGKLRNLALGGSELATAIADRAGALRAGVLVEVSGQLQQPTAYLVEAGAVLPDNHPWAQQAGTAREELLDELRRLGRGEASVDVAAWRRRLDELRRAYIAAYSELHSRARLGPGDDDRRKRLLNDPRLTQLGAMARIDILSQPELERWRRAVADVPACREFHAGSIEERAVCPFCGFKPVQTGTQPPAVLRLDQLVQQLGAMQSQWHAALKQNLASPSVAQSLASMTEAEKRTIRQYQSAADPEQVPFGDELVAAINRALRGLRSVALDSPALLDALKQGGFPCTVEELRQRLDAYVRGALGTNDPGSTRLTIEE